MELRHVGYFDAVAETLDFTRAEPVAASKAAATSSFPIPHFSSAPPASQSAPRRYSCSTTGPLSIGMSILTV